MTTPPPPLVLLTGAAGFIGAVTTNALANADFAVRAGTRGARSATSPSASVISVACDLDVPSQVQEAVRDTDVVVHAAYGTVSAMPHQVQTLLDAMSAADVSRLVHVSSVAIYGANDGPVDETSRAKGSLGAYAAAKLECERRIDAWVAADENRRAIVLRPGIVYGTGSRFWVDKLAERIARDAWGTFGPAGEGLAALVHVDDVAMVITAAARHLVTTTASDVRQPAVTALNVVGPEAPTWNAYFVMLAAHCGLPHLREISPAAVRRRQVLALGVKVVRALGLDVGQAAALAPTAQEMTLFSTHARYTGDALISVLGVTPQIDVEEGLRRTQVSRQGAGS